MGLFSREKHSARVRCTNCSRVISVDISQGTTIEKWGKRAKCANCKVTDAWERA